MIQMGSLCLLDKDTWLLTDIHSSNGAEKLSKKQREELGLYVMIRGDLTLSFSLHMPYSAAKQGIDMVASCIREAGFSQRRLALLSMQKYSKIPHNNKQENLNSTCSHTQYAIKMLWIFP